MSNLLSTPAGPVTNQQPHKYFTPQTPSPLRTSRNANLMPPPPAAPLEWCSDASPPLDTKSSPLALYTSASQPLFMIDAQQSRRSSTPAIFPALLPLPPTSTSRSSSGSSAHAHASFASRSRAATPQAIITAQNDAARDRRRILFRDKIRKQRDDARFEGRGDQVLRMDFVKERREWEERLARRAPTTDLDGDEGMKGMGDVGVHCEEQQLMVPLTEEEEIEALAQLLVDSRQDQAPHYFQDQSTIDTNWQTRQGSGAAAGVHQGSAFDSGGGGSYGSDEEDYDQLFMEVMGASREETRLGQDSMCQQWPKRQYDLVDQEDVQSSTMDLS